VLDAEVASYETVGVAVGDRFRWRSRPVELIDIAHLQANWVQVLVRFIDDANLPPVSMPYPDLIAGIGL
jgi:hypothetical protein